MLFHGNINLKNYKGCNNLIKEGAFLLNNISDLSSKIKKGIDVIYINNLLKIFIKALSFL